MKTKLITMIGALRPNTGKGNRVQPKFILRKFFTVLLMVLVAQIGWAGTRTGTTLVYDFNSSYSEGFSFTDTDDYIYRLKINSSPSLIVSESGEYMEDDTWTVFITR